MSKPRNSAKNSHYDIALLAASWSIIFALAWAFLALAGKSV